MLMLSLKNVARKSLTRSPNPSGVEAGISSRPTWFILWLLMPWLRVSRSSASMVLAIQDMQAHYLTTR